MKIQILLDWPCSGEPKMTPSSGFFQHLASNSDFFFTIGKKIETKKLRILKKLRVIPAKKLRLSEALCNVPGPKNWDYRRPYLVSSVQKNSEYEKTQNWAQKTQLVGGSGLQGPPKIWWKKSLHSLYTHIPDSSLWKVFNTQKSCVSWPYYACNPNHAQFMLKKV